MSRLEILQMMRPYVLKGTLHFCPIIRMLIDSGAISREDGMNLRDYIHRQLHPVENISYFEWMRRNHPSDYRRMIEGSLQLEARLAWLDHLIAQEQ